VGSENILPNVDAALRRAKEIDAARARPRLVG
jgi:hypothetical protein